MRHISMGRWRAVTAIVAAGMFAFGISLYAAGGGGADPTPEESVRSVKRAGTDRAAQPRAVTTTQTQPDGSRRGKASKYGPDKAFAPRRPTDPMRFDHDVDVVRARVISSVPIGSFGMRSGSGGSVAARGSCTCDADCATPASDCVVVNCISGSCEEKPAAINAPCDTDGLFCTGDFCDGSGNCVANPLPPCPAECVGGSQAGQNCEKAEDCPSGTCTPQSTCEEPGGGELLGTCKGTPDLGRCCSGMTQDTCAITLEDDCVTGLGGKWLRIADPEARDDSCFCPQYGSGITPRGAELTDVFPVVPRTSACQASIDNGDPVPRLCSEPTLDCPKRCVGGADDAKSCISDADCSGSAPCEFDTCTPIATACQGFTRIGDDYALANGQYMRLKELRFVGGVENGQEHLVFEFYTDEDPPQLVRALDPFTIDIINGRTQGFDAGGNRQWTIELDCDPDCDTDEDEDPDSSPFMIPPSGWVVMRTHYQANATSTGGQAADTDDLANGHWVATDAPADVGTNDPAVMWVDDGPTTTLPAGVSAGVLSFELVGETVPPPTGACCDAVTGECSDVPVWECRQCESGISAGEPCRETRDCGLSPLSFCVEPNYLGPVSRAEFILGDFKTCADAPCVAGDCCLPDGSCQELELAACNAISGAEFGGFGGSCDPNCCKQPNLTQGDCGCDLFLCSNGGSANLDKTCATSADCDPDRGRCADGETCSLASQDCADASTCGGTNDCVLCAGPVNHVIDVPSFLLDPSDPARTVTVDITGDTRLQVFGFEEGDTCTRDSTDDATYEKFSFMGHCETNPLDSGGPPCEKTAECAPGDSCVGACAVVTVDNCCSVPTLSPTFIVLQKLSPDKCPCDSSTPILFADVNAAGNRKFGFGPACDHDDPGDPNRQPCCQDNLSMQFTLPAGEYIYQPLRGRFCEGTVQNCVADDECLGRPCVDNGQAYQMHLTFTPCNPAACCLNVQCASDADCADFASDCNVNLGVCNNSCIQTNRLECEGDPERQVAGLGGQWLGDLEQPIALCDPLGDGGSQNPCQFGACCVGPGQCEDGNSQPPLGTLNDCLGDNPDSQYVGGINCDLQDACPVCEFQDPGHCQFIDDPSGALGPISDRHFGRRIADDFVAQGNFIDGVCWKSCPGTPQFPPGLPACDDNPPNIDDWVIKFYKNDGGANGGLPGTEIGQAGGFNVVPDAALHDEGSTCWEFSATIDPPVAVTQGECYWFEVSGLGTDVCNYFREFSDDGNSYSLRDADGSYGIEDVDTEDYKFCISSGISQATEGGVDGGCGDLAVACCLFPPPNSGLRVDCDDTITMSACRSLGGVGLPNGTCGVDQCPDPQSPATLTGRDECENAVGICDGVGPGSIQTDDPDIGVCAGDPTVVCLKSGLQGNIDSTACPSGIGPCGDPPAETVRCTGIVTDNRLATNDGPTTSGTNCSSSGVNSMQADVWFQYTAPCTGQVFINMCEAATYDGMLQVFGLETSDPVACPITNNDDNIACNDDFCQGTFSTTSAVQFRALKDAAYTIRVAGWTPDNGTLIDAGQGISALDVMVACDFIPDVQAPLVAASPHDRRKNRVISIDPTSNPAPVVMKVELLACSASGDPCVEDADCGGGGTCDPSAMLGWVSDPVTLGAASQMPDGATVVRVQKDMPALRVWLETVVHISDCEIAPVQGYMITASTDGVIFSNPLRIGTIVKPGGKNWADYVASAAGGVFTPPNEILNVDDLSALLFFFQGRTVSDLAYVVTTLELAGEIPTFVISAADLSEWLRAFGGGTYPPPSFLLNPSGDPANCP